MKYYGKIFGHFGITVIYLFASWVYLRKTGSKLPFYHTEETLALHKQTKSNFEKHSQITHFERSAFLETNVYFLSPDKLNIFVENELIFKQSLT